MSVVPQVYLAKNLYDEIVTTKKTVIVGQFVKEAVKEKLEREK